MDTKLYGVLYWDRASVETNGHEFTVKVEDIDKLEVDDLQDAVKNKLSNKLTHVDADDINVFVNVYAAVDMKNAIRTKDKETMRSLKSAAQNETTPFVVVAPMKVAPVVPASTPPRHSVHSSDERSASFSHPVITPPRRRLRENGEGLDVDNIDNEMAITYRQHTVKMILATAAADGAVLIRSPPMSGKSSMCSLLARYLRHEMKLVVHVSMLGLGRNATPEEWDRFWIKRTGQLFQYWFDRQGCTIVIDEAQILYSYGPFFDFVKMALQPTYSIDCTRLILFSAYNEPSQPGFGTPVVFQNPINIREMLLRQEEVAELFSSYAKSIYAESVPLDSEVFGLIAHYCGNHIGFMRRILIALYNRAVPPRPALTSQQVVEYLYSQSNVVDLSLQRALPSAEETSNPQTRNSVMQVINQPNFLLPLIDSNPAVVDLIKRGLLVHQKDSDLDCVGFASPVVKDIMLYRYLHTLSPSRMTDPVTFDQFLLFTLGLMNPDALSRSFSVAANGTLLERQWQCEFYRAASLCLGKDCCISPDVGRVFASPGYMDFYINSKLRWGVEITKGANLDEHLQRFTTGAYAVMTRNLNISEWKLVDFQPCDDAQVFIPRPNYWHVLYKPSDFKMLTLVYWEGGSIERHSVRLSSQMDGESRLIEALNSRPVFMQE